ncbi:MAG: hypothetical protein J0H15_00130 [Xanthomonadales bacterium]|nr:hypothetical protein [Xanthomonadales bacterium]
MARIEAPAFRIESLALVVREDAQASSLRLELARAEVPQLALDGRLEWSCALQAQAAGERGCAGPVTWAVANGEAAEAELAATLGARNVQLLLRQGERRLALTLPTSTGAALSASLENIPVGWLGPVVATVAPATTLRDGIVSAEGRRGEDGSIAADFSFERLGIEQRAPDVSVRELDGRGWVRWMPAEQSRLTGGLELHGGHLATAGFSLQLPAPPVTAAIDARHEAGRWDVTRLAWNDPGTLVASAQASLAPDSDTPVQALTIHLQEAALPAAVDRYGREFLRRAGFPGLQIRGGLTGDVALGPAGLERLALHATAVDITEPTRGVSVQGLDGGLDWSASGEGAITSLGWTKATVAGVAIPAARARWQARSGVLHQVGSLVAPLLGGSVELGGMHVDPGLTGEWLGGHVQLRRLGWDSADGSLAMAGFGAAGDITVSGAPSAPRIRLASTLQGGEVLAGPVYVKLPDGPVRLEARIEAAAGEWSMSDLAWRDPGVLELDGNAEVAPGNAPALHSLVVKGRAPDLAAALDRYGRSWLDARGFRDLAARGSLAAELALGRAGLERLAFKASDVDLVDARGRFKLRGLDGAVDWRAIGEAAPTTLGWQGLELYRLPFDAARLRLAMQEHALVLQQPVEIGVLGGALRLEKLSLLPRSPAGERYAGSLAIAGIEMAELAEVLGWPRFGGNLSGGIPEIEFSGDRLELRGGLDLYVFDGHVGVSGVSLERPFGVAPSLGANIHFENLDLDQVTRAFSFGGMTGRFFGSIKDLRLVDWSPVAFDAWLRTKGGGRMSYNAVNDITSIGGGGGLGASLQTMALSLFDTFGYSRLGIRCRLRDEVCLMGGIEPVPASGGSAGYTIVEGSGLPRITIVGHQRRVDWPTLVRRLSEATHGSGPVVH